MNLQDMPPIDNDSSNTGIGHPATSAILYVLSWLFVYFQAVSADEIWTWIWRGLSLVSLLLIIYINWDKAMTIFKSNKTKGQD